MLQELHSGRRVSVRGERWHIATVVGWTDCTEVRLEGRSASNDRLERTLLAPFDLFEPVETGPATRVSRRRWIHALADAAASARPATGLQAAHRAAIDLLPWQIEPALALASGAASRVLIADAVGMGKTVQALAALAELAARGEAERVLIVTPAGLRDQWSGELGARFGRACTVADAAFLAAASRDLPPGINPWSLPGVYIVSFDFLKRGEVSRALDELCWDLVIADEAHLAAPGTDRRAALHAAATRAARVILLTATPYAGDREGYEALCTVGQETARTTPDRDPAPDLIVFRRTRGALGVEVPARRTRVLHVRLTPAERRLHRLLERYTGRVWREAASSAARLAMIVLRKRALSSAWAVGRTIERRLALVGDPRGAVELQGLLPLDPEDEGEASADDTVPDGIVGAPGLSDWRVERDALAALLRAATCAARGDSKLRALARMLARTDETAIVFTEYRDTLGYLAERLAAIRPHAVLHGGVSREERAAASHALDGGTIALLLATDAAGEGLNLHHRCRWVINFELPWNPARLEQRAGRVDRYGQRRTPHALHFVARDTAEAVVLARLEARIRRARQAGWLGDVWPTEPEVAAAIVGGEMLPLGEGGRAAEHVEAPKEVTALSARACADALVGRPGRRSPPGALPCSPLLLEVGPRRLARRRSGLDRLLSGGRPLFVYRSGIRDGTGRIVDGTLTAILQDDDGIPSGDRGWVGTAHVEAVEAFRRKAADRLLARWRAIAAAWATAPRQALQPALFDRRALDLARTLDAARASLLRDLGARIERLERSTTLTVEPAELLLIARAAPPDDGPP